MELELIRTYYPQGTDGRIFYGGCLMMYNIELPHLRRQDSESVRFNTATVGEAPKDNHTAVGCIPEGRYELVKRCSPKFSRHLLVMNVPGRKLILIHPANDASHDLSGCIAPVTLLTGEGKGIRSRHAQEILINLVYGSLAQNDRVYLNIKSTIYDPG
jgi:hypothetical protein